MTRFRCSRIPARRANMPGCSRSAPIIARAARPHRTVCLIPASAHGTNPASAHMAGMEVVVVALRRAAAMSISTICAPRRRRMPSGSRRIMITYPSTHGVFEETVREICDIVHAHGGQVYLDGANLNAQVGLGAARRLRRRCQPPQSAQDLLHPAWRRRPRHGTDRREGASGAVPAGPSGRPDWPHAVGPVSAAPYGSASILPISWALYA